MDEVENSAKTFQSGFSLSASLLATRGHSRYESNGKKKSTYIHVIFDEIQHLEINFMWLLN